MSLFSVMSAAWLLSTGAVDPDTGRAMDGLSFTAIGKVETFNWRDAEDQVDGFITPSNRLSGEPFEVSVRVRNYDGEPFAGPVVMTVRPQGSQYGESVTVKPDGERWKHTFTVPDGGRYVLDLTFRTSRLKVVHGEFGVGQGYGLPLSTYGLGAAVLAALIVIGVAVIRAARSRKPDPA